MSPDPPDLEEWIAAEARFAAAAMVGAMSASHLVMDRPGIGQRVIPLPGSVLASPVTAHYDPDPDYFFHWFRDSAIVIDALRVALAAGYAEKSASVRFGEFAHFSRTLLSLNGPEFLRRSNFRAQVKAGFAQYLRSDADLAALIGPGVLADVRVNADGTPDVFRWQRPQCDGPALRCLALWRWWQQFPAVVEEPGLHAVMRELIGADLDFTLAQAHQSCSGPWEEEEGYHYYTQLVQAQALSRGAEWLESRGEVERARNCRLAGHAILSRLDAFWSEVDGFYRARTQTAGDPGKDLDSAVILAVLHAARTAGHHSVLDPKAQATVTALEELFDGQFAINRERPPQCGAALGRYAGDSYYGGGAWYCTTLAAAEFYFQLAQALGGGAELSSTQENARFRQRLGVRDVQTDGGRLARLALQRGDAVMRTVQAFTPASGELSEQFDRTTGAQTSAKQLTWSYAAFVTAAASREAAHRSIAA